MLGTQDSAFAGGFAQRSAAGTATLDGIPVQNPPSILIAEDNPDSRDALRTLLEAYGFRVTEAENGEEAVRKALTLNPDLILMDIMMPVMDGLEATKRLRETTEMGSVPIVALTAMAGSRDLAIEAGCDAYLSKPIDIPRFLQTIRGYLDAEGHGVSPPAP